MYICIYAYIYLPGLARPSRPTPNLKWELTAKRLALRAEAYYKWPIHLRMTAKKKGVL